MKILLFGILVGLILFYNLKAHLLYLWYVLNHKYYVYQAGRALGLPRWQLIQHDWTKFLPVEWFPYVSHFYGDKRPALGATGYIHQAGKDVAFDQAWEHHWRRNPHHWQYWSNERTKPEEMPRQYLVEMIADWRGAGLAQGKPDLAAWYTENKYKIVLAPETRKTVEWILKYFYGY